MPAPTKRFAALDTSFLLYLAAGDEDCQTVVDWLVSHNIYPVVTGTILQELADIEINDPDPFNKANAAEAITSLPMWGFLSIPLEPTQNGIARIIASRIVEKGLLPDENEDDGLAVAEAAIQECKLLITYRKVLLDADYDSLRLLLLENDVSDLAIIQPELIVKYLC
jgi:predicted nucleic acid-binding protein